MRLAEVDNSRRKEILAEYHEHREFGRRTLQDIGKYIPGGLLKAGKKLGIVAGKTLVFQTESEPAILVDYAVFNERSGGSFNAIERYLSMHKTMADQHPDFFQSLENSFYSVFEIISKEPGFGVGLRDVLTNTTHLLIDVNLSNTVYLRHILCGRIIPFTEGFYCTSGTFIPITHEWARKAIQGIINKFINHTHSEQQPVFSKKHAAAFQAEVIRILLKADETEHVGYI